MKITIEDEITKKLASGNTSEGADMEILCIIAEDPVASGSAINITKNILPEALSLEVFEQEHLTGIISSTIGMYPSINIKLVSADLVINRVPIIFGSIKLRELYEQDTYPVGTSTTVTVHYSRGDSSELYLRNTNLGSMVNFLTDNYQVTKIVVED